MIVDILFSHSVIHLEIFCPLDESVICSLFRVTQREFLVLLFSVGRIDGQIVNCKHVKQQMI